MEIHKLRPKDSGKTLRVLKSSRSSFYYRSLKDDSTVMMKLGQLTQSHSREGFWKYYYRLRNRGGKIDRKHRLMPALFLPAFPHPTTTAVKYQEKILLVKPTENGESTF